MYAIVTINSWEDLNIISNALITWVFRGHSNSSWIPKSTIERISDDFKESLKLLPNREFWILRQFQRRAHLLISAPPSFESKLEWLALIQHFGGPTRLVDFTHSLHIAAFFAMESACSNSAIWAIDLDAVQPSQMKLLPEETIDHLNKKNIAYVEQILKQESNSMDIVPVEPDRLNERMSIQKGTFLVPTDITKPFIENLCTAASISQDKFSDKNARKITPRFIDENVYEKNFPKVIKIIIPLKLHNNAMRSLDKLNINAQTLFPGLEGFARSLRIHLRMSSI